MRQHPAFGTNAQGTGLRDRPIDQRAKRTAMLLTGCLILACTITIVLATQPLVRPAPSRPPHVDPARLEAHVKRLSADFYPRSYDQPQNLERAAEYIAKEFKGAGAVVTVQEVKAEEGTYKNIIARFGPPSGPLLVVGAHYDSYADTDAATFSRRPYSPETHTPGADDNASGVAGLIELAHLLAQAQQARPIELVAYTLEEPPHFRSASMGSARHARALKAAQQEVRLMLALEMIGYFNDQPGSQSYPVPGLTAIYPERGNFIALVGKFGGFGTMRTVKRLMAGATDLPVFSINAPAVVPGIDFSDHRSYWQEGFPALMVTDTAFFRNRAYHGAADSWHTLDYARMAKVVQAVYAVTQNF